MGVGARGGRSGALLRYPRWDRMRGMWQASTGKACRLAVVLGYLAAQSVQGREPAEVVRHSCAQPGPDRVECEYRLSIPGRVPTVTAKVADLDLPPPLHLPYPYGQSITAILIVIDVGALERPDSGSRIPAHIERILAAVKPHHRVGVATFDAQPRVSLPLGASAEDIVTAVQTLTREPSPVALSQDAMAAIRSLAASPAARKAILFFGDESANPDAYYHSKLIAAARDAQVLVFGVVYPSTEPMAPALETLGQLAKESGGDLVIARAPDYELPEPFATDPFAAIDSGGRLSIDLTPAIGARLTGPQTLTLNVAAEDQALEIEVAVTLPAATTKSQGRRCDGGAKRHAAVDLAVRPGSGVPCPQRHPLPPDTTPQDGGLAQDWPARGACLSHTLGRGRRPPPRGDDPVADRTRQRQRVGAA
jgi:hypothetical protein